jgi:hypothetical protein
LKEILPAHKKFQGGERLILFQIDIFSTDEKNTSICPKKDIYARSRSI